MVLKGDVGFLEPDCHCDTHPCPGKSETRLGDPSKSHPLTRRKSRDVDPPVTGLNGTPPPTLPVSVPLPSCVDDTPFVLDTSKGY